MSETSLRIAFTPLDSGDVTVTDGRIIGEQGREVTIDAVPRTGYRFVRWEVTTTPVGAAPTVDRCEDRLNQSAGNSYCIGTTLYQPIYNADCTIRTEATENSPGCPSEGTSTLPCSTTPEFVREECIDTTLVALYTQKVSVPTGRPGETSDICITYPEILQENSSKCIVTPPPSPCLPAGTVVNTFCDGFTLLENVADGNCGINQRVKEFLSTTCNYVTPTPAETFTPIFTVTVVAPTPTPTPPTGNGGFVSTDSSTEVGAGGDSRGTEILE
jgi:hypothetical protein